MKVHMHLQSYISSGSVLVLLLAFSLFHVAFFEHVMLQAGCI